MQTLLLVGRRQARAICPARQQGQQAGQCDATAGTVRKGDAISRRSNLRSDHDPFELMHCWKPFYQGIAHETAGLPRHAEGSRDRGRLLRSNLLLKQWGRPALTVSASCKWYRRRLRGAEVLSSWSLSLSVCLCLAAAARNKISCTFKPVMTDIKTCHHERSQPSRAPRGRRVIKPAWLVGQLTASLQQLLLAIQLCYSSPPHLRPKETPFCF